MILQKPLALRIVRIAIRRILIEASSPLTEFALIAAHAILFMVLNLQPLEPNVTPKRHSH
jgi:hypothetical protein